MPQGKIGGVRLRGQMPTGSWIVIPGHKIERLCQIEIVDLFETEAHEIMGNKMSWADLTEDVYLFLLETGKGIRHEAAEIQIQAWVGNATSLHRNGNLGPFRVDMAPKSCSPGRVECLQRSITTP